jgi:hypothetical protein
VKPQKPRNAKAKADGPKVKRDEKGRWLPGASANPSGPGGFNCRIFGEEARALVAQARQESLKSIQTLIELRDQSGDERVRAAAAAEVLKWAWQDPKKLHTIGQSLPDSKKELEREVADLVARAALDGDRGAQELVLRMLRPDLFGEGAADAAARVPERKIRIVEAEVVDVAPAKT